MLKINKTERCLGKKANVFKREKNFLTNREETNKIHSGVVIAESTTHVQVYKATGERKDVSADSSEWFPIQSAKLWVEFAD